MDEILENRNMYRDMIVTYFSAFKSKDFSPVMFSPDIQFLSPISGTTMKAPDAVKGFAGDVATRVTEVNIIATVVEFPAASGVWQMTTTKGVQYTLHNFLGSRTVGCFIFGPCLIRKPL